MVVVQIFTLVLTMAFSRHSQRTMFPALSALLTGPVSLSAPRPGSLLPVRTCRARSSFHRTLEADVWHFHQAPPCYVFRAEKQMPIASFRENKMRTVGYFGSPFKLAVCSASAHSPVNTTKLNKNSSLEPRKTQPCGSAPMASCRYVAR